MKTLINLVEKHATDVLSKCSYAMYNLVELMNFIISYYVVTLDDKKLLMVRFGYILHFII